ncbi:MAG TPA: chemotaxis protein CheW [Candidatus Acidoferrales bacterium]|nr:chemotaxis protein CheW [Candidatus Acidoferrales bacterium]
MSATKNASQVSFVLLQVGHNRFALPAGIVAELAPPVRLHEFPHTSQLIVGVIVRRGRIVPVYDASLVLGGKSSSAQRFYLIARRRIGKASELAAIPVNGECELAAGELRPPAAESPAYIAGTLALAAESLDVLNLEALVASNAAASSEPGRAEAQP